MVWSAPRSRPGEADHDVPLRVFDWRPKYDAAGLARDALYLLRPDTYVALADLSGVPGVIDRYCTKRGIRLGIPSGPVRVAYGDR